MSNRFPLIIDAATQRILELPATDNLDLSSSNISNVSNINSVGNITANFFIGNGSSLTGITGSPAGSNTQIQYNNANAVGASANFTINTSTGVLAAPTFSGTTANLVNINVSGNLVPTNLILDSFNETLPASANTSTSISPNVALGTIFRYTANANFTFNGLTNAVAGSSATVIVTQDGTGNRLLTSTMRFAGNVRTLSTAANSIDIMGVFFDGSTYYASLTRGYV